MTWPLALAAPYAPPMSTPRRMPVRSTWVGADGFVWDLNDYRLGIQLMLDGVTGLHNPRVVKHRSESNAVPGHRPRGSRVVGRDVFWPLYVYGDGSEAWQDVYDRFFSTIDPDVEGVWTVTAGATTRKLRLTGVFDDDHQFPFDPYQRGWSIIPVRLEPSQPFWEGPVVKAGPFQVPAPVKFIPPEGAPVFRKSRAASFTNARINNPGDVDAWLKWVVRGPLTALELGVGGVVASVPFDVPDGETLTIDTDPRNVTAVMGGVDMTAPLGLVEFGPVPRRQNASLTIAATGAGSVEAMLTPLYMRAFGKAGASSG